MYGKSVKKKKKENENKIINDIISLTCKNNINMSSTKIYKLATLQNELDNIYEEKARGAFVRSRQKWMEAGEKNTKYFFGLEKRNREITSVNKLIINGHTNENPKDISCFVSQFYSKLYSPSSQLNEADCFLSNLSTSINKITSDYKNSCDKELNIEEIINCINSLKENKSPGNDGLTGEFYKHFCKDLAPFLLAVFKEAGITKTRGNYTYTQAQ